jgi:3-oxoacyl-[acyl-carrier protein] reductase
MDLGLSGKVALVCGGSRGIGYAVAEELVAEGAAVAICSRDGESLGSAARKLSARSPNVFGVAADLATREGVDVVVSRTLERFGRVDVLITNTGGPPTGDAVGHDWGKWEHAIAMMLRSAVELSRALVPAMRERRWGRVVGITSLTVKRPLVGLVLSNSVRAAVTGFFRTLAEEVAADSVTVNTVLPGYTRTERLVDLARATVARTGQTEAAVYDMWLAETPVKRLGEASEIAALIAFLASDRAGFITGQAVCADGGAVHSLF